MEFVSYLANNDRDDTDVLGWLITFNFFFFSLFDVFIFLLGTWFCSSLELKRNM